MMTVATLVVGIVCAVLRTAGEWKMLEKMGEKGWKALVPFLSEYLIFKNVWNTKMFWLSTVASLTCLGAVVVAKQMTGAAATPYVLEAMAGFGLAVALELQLIYKVSKAFGHGFGYMVGMIICPEIYNMILGFGKSEFAAA